MDLARHIAIFDPTKLQGETAVIGVGATGSATALEIAKLGVKDICLYDDDVIESHNIANQQLYGPSRIGEAKADVASHMIGELTGDYPRAMLSKVGTTKIYPTRAFICVDSMKARQEIFNKALFMNGKTELIVDMRINSRTVHVIIFNPMDLPQAKQYRNTLYDDADVRQDLGNCGMPISIGPTAHIASSLSCWLFIKWINNDRKINELIFQVDDWSIITNTFAEN